MTERPRPLPPLLTGLSARLLILTVAFVMLAELLIYTPSIAKYRMDWLQGRIAAARLVSLALDATPDYMVSEAVKAELLAHAEAYAIVIQKPGDVRRVLAGDMPPRADARFDLRGDGMMDMIGPVREAYMTLLGPGTRSCTSSASRRAVTASSSRCWSTKPRCTRAWWTSPSASSGCRW